MSEDERDEKPTTTSRKKGLTKTLLLTTLAVGFGSSFIYGYNIGVINAPQVVMGEWIREVQCARLHPELKNNPHQNADNTTKLWCEKLSGKRREKMFRQNFKLNAIWTAIASLFCVGGICGSLISHPIVGRIGRKKTLWLNNITGIAAAALLALPYFAQSYEIFMVGRFVAGFNGGITSAVAPLYMTEIPPTNLRGTLGGLHQFFIVFAIVISQTLGLPVILGNSSYWPILFGFGMIPCIFQLIVLPFCPESPKYLFLDKEKEHKAEQALKRFRGSKKYGPEMEELRQEYHETKDDPSVSMWGLFRDPALRRVIIIGIIITSSGQLSGHGTVVYYSTAIFKSAGLAGDAALYATIGMGCVYAISTFITALIVDRAGRRILMLAGLAGMFVLTVMLTLFLAIFQAYEDTEDHPYYWTPYASMVCIFLHVIFYSLGPGTIPAFFVSEMFPQTSRSAATGVALATNWVSALIVVLTFPFIQAKIEAYTFLIFAGLLVFFFVFTYFKIPETKGKTTQQILAELGGK